MPETFTSATNGPDDDAPFRSRLSFDLDVDICVVGAGLAGLTVALEAARLGASVAVLEGRHVGWNASGHQLGTVMPGYSLPIGDLIERVGLEDARELWALSKEGADYVRAAATEEAMPGIALTEGALEVSTVDAGETLISRLQTLSEDFETEVEGWQVDRVRDQLGTARYFHGIYYPRAFQIDGRKYIHGLAAQARRAGAASSRIRRSSASIRRDSQAHRDAVGAAARIAHRAGRQRSSRRAVAPPVGDAAAGLALCRGHGAARRAAGRGDRLQGVGGRQ
jgi:glycine/D-amino acid oxidase-like deaminating enzyme